MNSTQFFETQPLTNQHAKKSRKLDKKTVTLSVCLILSILYAGFLIHRRYQANTVILALAKRLKKSEMQKHRAWRANGYYQNQYNRLQRRNDGHAGKSVNIVGTTVDAGDAPTWQSINDALNKLTEQFDHEYKMSYVFDMEFENKRQITETINHLGDYIGCFGTTIGGAHIARCSNNWKLVSAEGWDGEKARGIKLVIDNIALDYEKGLSDGTFAIYSAKLDGGEPKQIFSKVYAGIDKTKCQLSLEGVSAGTEVSEDWNLDNTHDNCLFTLNIGVSNNGLTFSGADQVDLTPDENSSSFLITAEIGRAHV